MTAFATVDDLRDRGLTVSVDDETAATAILGDAAAYLRSVIGSDVYPQQTSTLTLHQYAGDEWLTIPVAPVISITSTTVDGKSVDLTPIDGAVRVCGPADVTLTVVHGYDTAPADLVAWNCVVASQVLKTVTEMGQLGAGEVTSFGIDDYRKGFKQGSDVGAFSLPQRVIDGLRSRYGSGVYVVGSR